MKERRTKNSNNELRLALKSVRNKKRISINNNENDLRFVQEKKMKEILFRNY